MKWNFRNWCRIVFISFFSYYSFIRILYEIKSNLNSSTVIDSFPEVKLGRITFVCILQNILKPRADIYSCVCFIRWRPRLCLNAEVRGTPATLTTTRKKRSACRSRRSARKNLQSFRGRDDRNSERAKSRRREKVHESLNDPSSC